MRQPSLKPAFPNMPPSAAAMRHLLLRLPSCLANASEEAPQPRRRQMRALVAAATTGMSSQIQLIVRPRLELPLILTLQHSPSPTGLCVARFAM